MADNAITRAHTCIICKQKFSKNELFPLAFIGNSFLASIKSYVLHLPRSGFMCSADLNHYKSLYVKDILEANRGDLSDIEKEVSESFQSHELISADANEEHERQLTLGEWLADRLSELAGSWSFILGFHFFIALWILINTFAFRRAFAFDPFPYILLNLILSCLAAVQAPIIMISQNRREDRDRIRAENDYQVNLKAEMEIQQINMKLDAIIKRQGRSYQQIDDMQQKLKNLLVKKKAQGKKREP